MAHQVHIILQLTYQLSFGEMRVVHKVKGLKYIQQHFALPFRVIFSTMKVIFTVAYTIYLIYITNKALISF